MNFVNSLSTNSELLSTNMSKIEFQNNNSDSKSANKTTPNHENVWILRDEFKSNSKQKRVPTSCLKLNSTNRKSNKCVHYAPLLSQELGSNINKSNTKNKEKKKLNNYTKEPQSILRQSRFKLHFDNSAYSIEKPATLNNRQAKRISASDLKSDSNLWIKLTPSDQLSFVSSLSNNSSSEARSSSTCSSTSNESTTTTTETSSSSLSISGSASSGSLQLSGGEEFQTDIPTRDTIVSEYTTNNFNKNVKFFVQANQNNLAINNSETSILFDYTNTCKHLNKMKMKKIKMKTNNSQVDVAVPTPCNTKTSKNKNKKVDFTDNIQNSPVNSHSYEDLNDSNKANKTVASSSVSSTSSGISSNISSASSTTSEIPSSDNNLILISSNTSTTNSSSLLSSSSSSSSTSSSSAEPSNVPTNCIKMPIYSNCRKLFSSNNKPNQANNKLAPKAIISDDGDIEIESLKQSPIINRAKHSHRQAIYSPTNKPEQQLNILLKQQNNIYQNNPNLIIKDPNQQRHSMRVVSNSNTSFNRTLNERLSQRIVSTTKQPTTTSSASTTSSSSSNYENPINKLYCNNNFINQSHSKLVNNNSIYSHHQQNQLAAAAAAASAMEKEKQREALKEYIKTQQLQQLQQQQRYTDSQTSSSFVSQPPTSSTSSSSSYNPNYHVPYSNVLPRKQLYLGDSKLDDCSIKVNGADPNSINKLKQYIDPTNNSDFINRTSRCASASTNAVAVSNLKQQKSVQINNLIGINHNLINATSVTGAGLMQNSMQQILKTPVKRDTSLGLCYLTFGQETKRTLLPNQVTGIDTVKALFVRAFPDKLTMNFLDDEQTVKIYIKDQQKDLFYQLDEMNDIKDRCVLKLVELNSSSTNDNSSKITTPIAVSTKSTVSNNWPNSSATVDQNKHTETLINEYYSPSVSIRQCSQAVPSNGFTSNSYQYNTTNALPAVPNNTSQPVPGSNHRSSSEPRFNPAPVLSNNQYNMYHQNAYNNNTSSYNNGYVQNQAYHKPSYSNDFQDFNQNQYKYIMSNNDTGNRHSSETYDNLSDHNPKTLTNSARIVSPTNGNDHQSRIDAKFNQLNNIYDKYSSIRANTIKSSPTTVTMKKERDIKSVDREIVSPFTTSNINNSNRMPRRNSSITTSSSPPPQIKSDSNRNSSHIMMGLGAKQHRNLESHLRDLKSCDRDFINVNKNRSGSITPANEDDLTEDDETSVATNSISYGSKRLNSFTNKKTDDLTSADLLIDETNLINSLDDSGLDSRDNSKIKMKLMQNQLEKLTNLVHKALANRDLNQLAAQCDLQNMFDIDFSPKTTQQTSKKFYSFSNGSVSKTNKNLTDLNNKTKMLRNDLSVIKKLHESFNSSFGDSMKTFANQLNDKVKSFCLNEINEKIKLDLIVYKYQVDSNKIETELSDLETVVDDLRENILKHRCNVNIDDVECYALALSQLSKQLVGLKTSFSGMKEHLKASASSFSNTSNQSKQQQPFYSYKYSENKFLTIETAKLDLIIRRCKRITGILIILKKLAIAPREHTQFSLENTLKKFYSSTGNQSSVLTRLNKNSNILTPIVEQQNDMRSTDTSKNLLKEIESIKPDHEQRKLAIEESESTIKKKLKFRLQKSALKEENNSKQLINDNKPIQANQQIQTASTTNQALLTFSNNQNSKTNTNSNQTQNQTQHNLMKSTLMDRSYLETVHEEDLSLTNELQDDNSECSEVSNSLTSTMEIGVNIDYSNSTNTSTNSLTQQTSENTNQTLKNSSEKAAVSPSISTSLSSNSVENISSETGSKPEQESSKPNENQLYEQLSQMKPLKPLNFKSSTSICLNQKENTPQSEQNTLQTSSLTITPLTSSSSDEQSSDKATSPANDSKMTSSSTSSLSSNSSNGNVQSENTDSTSIMNHDEISTPTNKSAKNDVSSSSSTCSFSSSGYNSDNTSNKPYSKKSEILIETKDSIIDSVDLVETKSEQNNNAVSTTMVVIPRRNSSIFSSNTNSSQSGSTASRRVSLSVTDL